VVEVDEETPEITGDVVAEEVLEEVEEETAEENEELEEESEEVVEEGKEVQVGDTTVAIDLDAIKAEVEEEEAASKMNFEDYKWYLAGAAIIIAMIVILSTGVIKKVIDFFEEE